MPVEGFPDASKHKICMRCRSWFEPEEGDMVFPSSFSFLLGLGKMLRIAVSEAVGDESVMRFMCHACQRKKRREKIAIWTIVAILVMGTALFSLSVVKGWWLFEQ